MQQYLELGRDILTNGNDRGDRTGTGTRSIFGRQIRFDLSKGFPLLTTKRMWVKGIIHELLWFLKGDTNNNSLVENGVHIWDEWAVVNRREYTLRERYQWFLEHKAEGREFDDVSLNGPIEEAHVLLDKEGVPRHKLLKGDGELGPIYAHQWRSWRGKAIGLRDVNPTGRGAKNLHFTGEPIYNTIDQIKELIENLKSKPFSRRHVVSAWNVADLPDESKSPQQNVLDGKMALAPCHCLFQFYVEEMPIRERIQWIRLNKPEADEEISEILMKEIKEGKFSDELDDELIARNNELYLAVEGVPRKLSCQLYQR